MNKLILRYFSLILLLIAIIYFGSKLYFQQGRKPTIEFGKDHFILDGFIKDTLYPFKVAVINESGIEQKYSVASTCGCTLLDEASGVILPKGKDTVSVVLNTYGKNSGFSSMLILYNDEKAVDTLPIFAKKLSYEKD